ncbi:TonB-dependent receptor [Parapedobacter indicus]|uniref:Outer membrane receptor proteins, mostly Fe transport n=1 Tax=Parapedobacter indicus TaxID=1477437 RepID=A0A1I3TDM0_9SPHI|nr:TonB-dependent receptor plug domain-containing protein [Parapedobacter indicus]PPK99520.1 outer membrane receptor protein involved in Fe transport [Parapedobacter indicus]SFJ69278.1 Outer membrane receptor proteins, mostly Fe transport [Parapedobacter indicus]
MQYIKFYVTVLFFCGAFWGRAQESAYNLTGTISGADREPLYGATIKVGNQTTLSDSEGHYRFSNIRHRQVRIEASAVGFEPYAQTLTLIQGANTLQITLLPKTNELETVEVVGLTKAQEVNRQAYNVTAVDATKLYNTTMDISGALDRVAGIRVRESGGVGSNFNLSLNGFTGNHIRYFIDGIPMDNFGSSFQINNIPINTAERIEVYKGVVPMWLGSDALGGAINIVTGDRYRNFVDVSYSYGSFNTHRSVINTAYTTKEGFTVRLNAYQNYSDNNYKVTVEAADINTGAYAPNTTVHRFHDTYHNEAVIASVGVVDKRFADQLLAGITLGQNYKEIQTGARMVSVFGGWHRRGTTVMPTIKYKKENLIEGLDVIINANYNFGSERNIDTVSARFDWFGNSKPTGTNSGERSRSLYKYRNNEGLATATANYRLAERHSFTLNNNFSTFRREGSDPLNPTSAEYERTKRTYKNVMGLGYSYDIKDLWSSTLFLKYIHQSNQNGPDERSLMDKLGYGLASAYYLTPQVQLKVSYELTNRMPSAYEIFGDVENQEANFQLQPERSNNVNLGAAYDFALRADHRFSLNANVIYRRAFDYIYSRLNNNQSKYVADNRDGVETYGGDVELRYSFKNWLMAGATATYQHIMNTQKYEEGFNGISIVYGDQMPNIPYLFGNADVAVVLRDIGRAGNTLHIGYNLLYVHAFYLYWPSRGGNKFDIPQQISHDVNVVYSLQDGRYNLALEAKNITDTRMYDNFSLQKPSRGFYLNLRYFINKK